MKSGLFVGLITLDFLYLAREFPSSNQKIVAADYTVAAGGPATNAAVTFNYLGNSLDHKSLEKPAQVCGVLGATPLAGIIHSELRQQGVEIIDLLPESNTIPPISSVIITQGTGDIATQRQGDIATQRQGDRAVISLNASKTQAGVENLLPEILTDMLENVGIVLIDGHQLEAGIVIAKLAKSLEIPTVLDGGSWKSGLEKILPYIDYAICSDSFYPPDCTQQSEVITYLIKQQIKHIAITRGAASIIYATNHQTGEIKIPQTPIVDTLGAGDIYHGAFCYYFLDKSDFVVALTAAVEIARKSCSFFGTRSWLNSL